MSFCVGWVGSFNFMYLHRVTTNYHRPFLASVDPEPDGYHLPRFSDIHIQAAMDRLLLPLAIDYHF